MEAFCNHQVTVVPSAVGGCFLFHRTKDVRFEIKSKTR